MVWTAVSSTTPAPATASRTVGCSKQPGTAPHAETGSRLQTAPEAEATLPARAGITCAQGSTSVDAGGAEPGLGAGGELLHGEHVDVEPADQVDDGRRGNQPLAQAHGRDPEPRTVRGGADRRPAGGGAPRPPRTAPEPADSSAAAPDRARTASASGSTAAAAAYGVKDMAGTRGNPRSVPVARRTAHAAHGSAATVACRRRRFPAATIGATVARDGAVGDVVADPARG